MKEREELRILFAEDVPSDAELAMNSLRNDGIAFVSKVVDTAPEFRKAMIQFNPDLIISDYSMPLFSGLEALRITREQNRWLPFILFTGSINEETAVECMKAGANDYVIKERMARLPYAVKEVLDQSRIQAEKRAAEQQLMENQARLTSIYDAAPGGIGLVIDRIFIEVNDIFCELTGYDRSELVGQCARVIYPTDEEFEYVGREKYKSILLTGSGSVETRIKRKDGSIRTIIMSSSAIDRDDLSKGITFTALDITNVKQAEEELSKLSTAVEQNPVSVVITDYGGNVEYVNPKFCEITGYSKEELLGKNPSILSSGDMSREEYSELWAVIKSGKIWKGEFHNRRKNGQLYWESASISPIVNAEGAITHFVGIKEDITERKRSEHVQRALYRIAGEVVASNNLNDLFEVIYTEISELFDSRNFYIALYDKETGMLSTPHSRDEKDDISSWPAEKSITGYVMKTNQALMVHRDDVEKMIGEGTISMIGTPSAIWLGVPLSIDGQVDGALVIQDYDNPDAFDNSDLEMLTFIAGQISLSVQRQKSIADLKESLRLAEATNRLKTSFLNNISHEVRTPLNGILGFAQFVTQPGVSDDEKAEFLGILNSSSERLLNTITSYMDISLITSGAQTVNRISFSLNLMLDRLYIKYLGKCRAKGIELVETVPDQDRDIWLVTDQELLEKALTHLLDNALKFTSEGMIEFGYEAADNSVNLFVKDTGEGIKNEAQKWIFEYFMQEDISVAKKYEGSGLGLSIVKGIAGLLGGDITLQSEKDAGSMFIIELPINEKREETMISLNETEVLPVKNETSIILIVEDDDMNYDYIRYILSGAGFFTERAVNGQEALNRCSGDEEFSLVLMDLRMPLMDGIEATNKIREAGKSLPIVAVTAHAMNGDRERAISAGCDDYISKPFRKEELLNIVNRFVTV